MDGQGGRGAPGASGVSSGASTVNWGDGRLPERFWNKVVPEPNSGCWLWTGSTDTSGYGLFRVDRRLQKTHRWAFMNLVGPIEAPLVLDHLCRETACCNPQHLERVTRQVNTLRGQTPAAANAAKTHCPRGHAYAGTNLLQGSWHRGRACRECKRLDAQARYRRRRVAGP